MRPNESPEDVVRLYELAAERGDDQTMDRASAAIDTCPQSKQRRPFPHRIADVLRLGWDSKFDASREVLGALLDAPSTEGERALSRALLALVCAAVEDDGAARRFARDAISGSARPAKRIGEPELRYRRLARALAAVASELVGDVVRGRRAAQARFVRLDSATAWLTAHSRGSDWTSAPVEVRGYARFVRRVCECHAARTVPSPLTATELTILRLVADGQSAPRIAVLLDRSPHTVRTHLRNAYAKINAHGRREALHHARLLGLLDADPSLHCDVASPSANLP